MCGGLFICIPQYFTLSSAPVATEMVKPPKLENIEDDREVRNLIYNRIVMDAAVSTSQLQRELTERYGERYPDMSLNDWRHIIDAYAPMVRETAQREAKEISMQPTELDMAAEPK